MSCGWKVFASVVAPVVAVMVLGFSAPAPAQAAAADPAGKKADPAPAVEPVKVESAAQAAGVIDGLAGEARKAAELKLDFESARAAFAKVQAVRPFADKLDAAGRAKFNAAEGAIGLMAGEPAAALEGCQAMVDANGGKDWALFGFVAAYILGDKKSAEALMPKMDASWVRGFQDDVDVLGKKLPSFKLDLLGGGTYHSSDEKVVLFDFWATWCGPCIRLLPKVKEHFEQFKKYDQFLMIGVSMDQPGDRQKVAQFVRDKDMGWSHYFEGKVWEGPLSNGAFGMRSIPHLAVMAPGGRILFKCSPVNPFLPCAVYAGIREVEKQQAAKAKPAPPAPNKPGPKPPASSQPAAAAAPARTVPATGADKADQMLKLADSYNTAGMKDKADELYKQLIADFPGSPQAAKARIALGANP